MIALGLLSVLFVFAVWKWARKSHNLPGPRGYPLLGNVLDMPRSHVSENFAKLRPKYGDVVYLSVFAQGIVVLNSQKAAMEILGTKGDTSAGRPILTMASELSGYDRFLALHQNGERHRAGRTYLHGAIGPQHAREYASAQEEQVVRFLKKLLDDPENFEEHCKWIVGACILLITYGHNVDDYNDPYIEASSGVMQRFSVAAAPGRWLVDLIPALKHVPTWFPGAHFKKFAALCRVKARQAFEAPFLSVKQQMKDGVARRSLVASYLEASSSLTQEEEEFIMFTMGDLYGAGLHTMSSGISSFFLAMVMNPTAQKKAQAEIDAVCDMQSRLPTFADKSSMPYVEALLWEVLRWGAITPLGLPHRFTQDETYEGLQIKEGMHAFANISAISFDPESYPEPEVFRPERFIGPNPQPDPRKIVFGYGRRLCPGNALAEMTMLIIIARTLATFDIQPRKGEKYSISRTDGVIAHNNPFQVDINVRSGLARDLILGN
ncbi:cytochrome P450 [Mycena maculata]|uniref:Cytochrome P450 n=1 Tax=Mycena maculata TaxID=230809 RepID=A0AAD7J620_9AGAR|nr:cytochrome P450 [Mycena maculata]